MGTFLVSTPQGKLRCEYNPKRKDEYPPEPNRYYLEGQLITQEHAQEIIDEAHPGKYTV